MCWNRQVDCKAAHTEEYKLCHKYRTSGFKILRDGLNKMLRLKLLAYTA